MGDFFTARLVGKNDANDVAAAYDVDSLFKDVSFL